MRLLHTTDLTLSSFTTDIPQYAILSHTWGDDEVLFSDVENPAIRQVRLGWEKVSKCCQRAAQDGWQYVWIDTCCIDKTDPTELGEAINSMFRWYEKAEICYAYLSDVPPRHSPPQGVPWKWFFRSSRWFARGWTLQELLAPAFLLFLDDSWGTIGSREEWSPEIESATGIGIKQLLDFRSCCVATKLSWAANRQTTRVEDRAYSLLGLLGVSLPLIYGEGCNAFIRLQHELIRSYNDETIFVWGRPPFSGNVLASGTSEFSSDILAPSPESFAHSNGLAIRQFDHGRRGFTMTNAGLSLNVELFEFPNVLAGGESLYAIQLNCAWAWPPLDDVKKPMVLFLVKDPSKSLPAEHSLVFFQRRGVLLRDWGEMSSTYHKTLGRHNILITRKEAVETGGSVFNFVITPRYFPPTQLGVVHRYIWSANSREWKPEPQFNYKDKTDIRVSTHEALILESSAYTKKFSILLKWTPRMLSIGVLHHASAHTPSQLWFLRDSFCKAPASEQPRFQNLRKALKDKRHCF
ncbi:heterokaryon incompatibility protein-domain-containing protein [Thelonectria olida]|uniref:Heterokaryon incompatibility protein-domain-containing protein n=1 Tax=Thelonectria olida TaxID=1576542 RepID=A0A9P8W257_9HYPO|nr:heterokaryon incompatibility protein-domain-containing protein [Thelonectria olida]